MLGRFYLCENQSSVECKMLVYTYKCEVCGNIEDVRRPIAERDDEKLCIYCLEDPQKDAVMRRVEYLGGSIIST